MKNVDILAELIEQVACSTNMLSSTDLSEVEKMQTILEQIDKNIAEIDGPAQLLKQARGTTSEVSELLQKILQKEAEDTNESIESILKTVTELQDCIEQITEDQTTDNLEPVQEPACEIDEAPSTEDTCIDEAPSTEAVCIDEDDAPLVLDFITEASEHIESSEAGLLELEAKPDDNEVINQIFRAFHTIKGMAGFLNLTEIGSLAHSAENLLDLARNGKLALTGKNTNVIFESIDLLKKMIATLKEAVENGIPLHQEQSLSDLLAKLEASAEGRDVEIALDTPEAKEEDEKLDNILEIKKDEPKAGYTAPQNNVSRKAHASDEKIKVSTTRLDNLINMTGELVIAQLMVSEQASEKITTDHELNRKITHQGKIIRDLQELSMSMRMVPIAAVFHKMARLARDLSQKADKAINFVTSGEETELDRNIVDKIADPLVHMIRNSADHGVESPEERTKAGKDPTGRIELRAFHQAGNIVIEIEDDGKGLDKERILKKAIDNGVVEHGQDLSDEEIFKLIFHAGLSTAQKITSVSGRGVGMDVVKKNIEALRGKIDISSTPGKGSTFTIRLPLTLAIIDGQVVKIGNDRYIVPINSIIRTLRPEAKQISSVQNRGEMVMERGELLPLVRLYKLFGATPITEDPTESLLVIIEEDNKKCCLLVDELLGQQQVVIKSLGDSLAGAKGVSGGAIMGDGKISLILDAPGLMELAQN